MPTHTLKFVSEKDMGIDPSEDMLTAFKLISQSVDKAVWISNVEIFDLTDEDKSTIFICDHFEGTSYSYLKDGNYRIFGPRYYIYCHQKDLLADHFDHPCFTAVMKGLVICCTNIARDRRLRLHEKIKLMGGKVIRTLTMEATHLVTDQVTSKKYLLAAGFRRPIYVSEWIDRCWHDGKTEFFHATDKVYDKYLCPIFKGLNITVSQLQIKERAAIKEMIEQNGGQYDGCLKVTVTTHLVLKECTGDKYKMAKSKKIVCVNPLWIYDSIKNGFCADEQLYIVGNKNDNKDSSLSMGTSNIDRSINETYLSNSSEKSFISDKNEFEIDFAKLKAAGQFLDGCKIVLIGFSLNTFEVLKNVLNKGGATRFDQVNEHVTHVIMGKLADKNNKNLLDSNYRPHVVNIEWLSDSIKAGRALDESQYFCFKFPDVNSLTPFKTSQPKTSLIIPTISPKDFDLNPADDTNDFTNMVSQYLPTANNEDVPEQRLLFAGLVFGIFGFENKDFEIMEKNITVFGGIVNNNKNLLDYGIVPVHNVDISTKVVQLATYFWLQSCFDDNCVYEIMEHPLFSPISFDVNRKPLSDCVVSISNYAVNEREIIINLAELLGAKYQERFSKTTRTTQSLLANTHLITNEPTGKKYEGAISWNIPVVTYDWLIQSAKMCKKLDDQPFLVGNSTGSKSSYITSTPKATPQKLDFSNGVNEKSDKASGSFQASQNNLPQTPTVYKEVMAKLNDSLIESRINTVHERMATGYRTPTATNSTIKRLQSEESRLSFNTSASDCTPDSPFSPCKPILGNYNGPNPKLRDIRSHLLDSPANNNRTELKNLFFKGVRNALKQDIEEDRCVIPNRKLSLCDEELSVIEGPLNGVIVVVSKKLEQHQRELNKLAERLGATCRWKYDAKATHLIHEAKRGECNKEAIKAESDGKFVVSREWLYACRDRNSRVNEEDYPCTYNSRLALDVSKKISVKTPVDNSTTKSPLLRTESTLSMNSEMNKLLAAAKVAENKRKAKTTNVDTSYSSFFKEGIKKPPPIPRKDAVSEETIQNFESVPVTWGDSTINPPDFQARDRTLKENEYSSFQVADDELHTVFKPKILLAGVTIQEKQEFYKLVVGLGGEISLDKDFNPDFTHLVAGLPNYTEKCVASIAKGLWVLKKSYLEACNQNSSFVNEEDYEWGANNEYDPESKEYKLAKAAKNWRVKINEMRKNNISPCGAFYDWKVLVLTEPQRANSFIRILSAGGAEIITLKPPFSNLQNVTHAFMELTRVPIANNDLESLVEQNVLCLKFEYITAYLVGEGNVNDFLISEVKHLADKYSNPLKGKRSSESSPEHRKKSKS